VSTVSFLVFVGLGAAVAAPITTQGVVFAKHAPQYLRQAQQGKGPVGSILKRFHLEKRLDKIGPSLSRILASTPERVVGLLQSAASTVASVAIVVILAIFMLVEGPSLVAAFLAGLPEDRREPVRRVGQTMSRVVGGYTVGIVFLAILNGLVTAAALALTGVPFVTSLAVWAGLADILPVIGGLIGIVPAGIFAFTHSLIAGIVVVGAMFAYQQVKNHVLYPIVVGRAVNLNALPVLVAVLAGFELLGITGALLAIPVAGTLQAVVVELAPAPVRMFLHHPELSKPSTPPPEGSGSEPRLSPEPSPDGEAGGPETDAAGALDGDAAGARRHRARRRRR
jgi:predicted PurR-regulated permease PerM